MGEGKGRNDWQIWGISVFLGIVPPNTIINTNFLSTSYPQLFLTVFQLSSYTSGYTVLNRLTFFPFFKAYLYIYSNSMFITVSLMPKATF